MADVKWIKLSTEMFDDEKIKLIRKLPDGNNILLVWIQMLIQAGKSNMSGHILLSSDIPMTDEMFATIYDMDINTVRHALKILHQFRMISFDEESVMYISNWEKHQNVAGMEMTKQLRAARNKRYYDKKKQLDAPSSEQDDVKTSYKTEQDVLDIEEDIDKEIDIDKEKKKKKESKKKFLDYVKLTPSEYEKLIHEHGEEKAKAMIEKLNNYLATSGKTYRSHYHTMIGKGWVLSWYNDELRKKQTNNGKRKELVPDWAQKKEPPAVQHSGKSEEEKELERRELESLLGQFRT